MTRRVSKERPAALAPHICALFADVGRNSPTSADIRQIWGTRPNFKSSAGRLALHNLVALTLTIALAAASYRWLETPFLKLKQRFTHVLSRTT